MRGERALTGEPNEVKKSVEMPSDTSNAFPNHVLFSSTSVVNGRGHGVVIASGTDTVVGQISKKIGDVEEEKSPLERVMTRLGGIIIVVIILLIIAFTVVLALQGDVDARAFGNSVWLAAIYEGFNLATVIIPATLPLAVLMSMDRGVKSLAKVGAQMRRLTAVETLGAATVICSDKTGTLTEGKMTCVAMKTATPSILAGRVTSALDAYTLYPSRGFNPYGGVFDSETAPEDESAFEGPTLSPSIAGKTNFGSSKTEEERATIVRAALAATLINCSDTRIVKKGRKFEAVGNMSEAALVVACAKAGFWRGDAADVGEINDAQGYSNPSDAYESIESLEVPFASRRKMKATVHKLDKGSFMGIKFGTKHLAVVKGAPDRLLPFVDAEDDEAFLGTLAESNEEYAGSGLRILFTCVRPIDDELLTALNDAEGADERLEILLDEENPLTFLCMFGLMDPPRSGVKESIAKVQGAGIRVVMITGDQISTAASISDQIGIIANDDAADIEEKVPAARMCSDLHIDPDDPANSPYIDPPVVNAYTRSVAAWARAQPMDKVRIVESLDSQGETTVMTGDGVNDSAALKRAAIGVSMGISGTDVAKGSADMILMDDNFTTIVNAVEEGRRIFGNLQKYLLYYLGTKSCEVFLFSITTFGGYFSPIAGVRGILAAMALTFSTPLTLLNQPAEPYQMHVPPRPKKLFLGPLTSRICVYRILPMILIYQIGVLAPTFLAKEMYTGTLSRMVSTDSWLSFLQNKTNCIVPQRDLEGNFTGDKGWIVEDGSAKAPNPVWCTCPNDLTLGSKTFEQVGAVGGATLALDDGQMNDEVAKSFGFSFNEWVSDGRAGTMYDRNNSGGKWDVYYGIDKTVGLYFDNVQMLRPCHKSNNMCWTKAAIKKYGDDVSNYPAIAEQFSCGKWGLRKANTAGWYSYVWGELSVAVSVRSEAPFWKPSHVYGVGSSKPNWGLWTAVFLSIVYTFVMASVPGIRTVTDCLPLNLASTAMVFGFVILMLVLNDFVKTMVYYPILKRDQATAKEKLHSTWVANRTTSVE